MLTGIKNFGNILFSSAHLKSPFHYSIKLEGGKRVQRELSKTTKAVAVTAAIILAIPTLGLGSVASLYLITAIDKYSKLYSDTTVKKASKLSSHKLFPGNLPDNKTEPHPNDIKTGNHPNNNKTETPPAVKKQNTAKTSNSKKTAAAPRVIAGIQNLGNTCWLNSLLKFLATDNAFNAMLNRTDQEIKNVVTKEIRGNAAANCIQQIQLDAAREVNNDPTLSEEEKAAERNRRVEEEIEDLINEETTRRVELLKNLNDIILDLQSPKHRQGKRIDSNQVYVFLNDLHQMNNHFELGHQCDASDALNFLAATFGYPNENELMEVSQITQTYANDEQKKPSEVEYFSILTANAIDESIYTTHNKKRCIDLNKCVNIPQIELGKRTDEKSRPTDFAICRGLTNAPKTLTINVGRNGLNGKINDPVLIKDDFLVKITTHHEQCNWLEKNREVSYEITGAIIHLGADNGGHYTYIEKNGNNFYYHNDSSVREVSKEAALDYFKQASTFKLKNREVLTAAQTSLTRSTNTSGLTQS